MALLAFPARHLAWTESAIFGFDHFLPISKAYLLEISICTASWWVVASRANSCGARDLCGQAFTQNIHPIWSEASACGKHPSVHVGPWSYGCRVDSSVYQSFHARFCKFSLRSALNCRISESTIYIRCNSCLHVLNWVCTFCFGQVLANFRSLSSGNLDWYSWLTVKFLPVENILLCTYVPQATAAE